MLLVYGFFFTGERNKDRDLTAWLPKQKILRLLARDSVMLASEPFQCLLTCNGLDTSDVRVLLRDGEVKNVERQPPFYVYKVVGAGTEKQALELDFEWNLEKERARLVKVAVDNREKKCGC